MKFRLIILITSLLCTGTLIISEVPTIDVKTLYEMKLDNIPEEVNLFT